MRIMAIDPGDARTGVALSDPTGMLVTQSCTFEEKNSEKLRRLLCEFALSNDIGEIVLGYPKNMNATLGERAKKSEELAGWLSASLDIKVVLWDERRTSVDANRILNELGTKNSRSRRSRIDGIAASLILEGYLTYRSRSYE